MIARTDAKDTNCAKTGVLREYPFTFRVKEEATFIFSHTRIKIETRWTRVKNVWGKAPWTPLVFPCPRYYFVFVIPRHLLPSGSKWARLESLDSARAGSRAGILDTNSRSPMNKAAYSCNEYRDGGQVGSAPHPPTHKKKWKIKKVQPLYWRKLTSAALAVKYRRLNTETVGWSI